jgi:ferredoxin-like protein FixX
LILLIGCYNIISWDVKILYHSCVECCTGLIVRLCIVPASV